MNKVKRQEEKKKKKKPSHDKKLVKIICHKYLNHVNMITYFQFRVGNMQ